MKCMIRVAILVAVMGVMYGRADAQVDIKVAGGGVLDPTRVGGHLSIDIPIGDTYPTYISPFVEFYSKSGIDEIPAGISLIYKAPFSDRYGTVFFGVGGGMIYARGFPLIDSIFGNFIIDQATGQVATGTSSEAMLSVLGGLRLDVADRVGVIVQGRWFRAFATGSTNNIALHAGLAFTLGER